MDKDTKLQLLESNLRCNCDLDNWSPEVSSGHSVVCRIHKGFIGQSQYRFIDEYSAPDNSNRATPADSGKE